jgi:hypothetical protein
VLGKVIHQASVTDVHPSVNFTRERKLTQQQPRKKSIRPGIDFNRKVKHDPRARLRNKIKIKVKMSGKLLYVRQSSGERIHANFPRKIKT